MRNGLIAALVVAGLVGIACSRFNAGDEPVGTPDGGPEGGPSMEGPFCKRQPASLFLCDDFDEGPLGFNWGENAEQGGLNAFDTEHFVSPPKSLVSQTTDAGGQGWAYLEKQVVPATVSRIVTAFDLRIDGLGPNYAQLWSVRVLSGANVYGVYLRSLSSGALQIDETNETKQIAALPFSKVPVPGKWVRLRFEVTLRPPAKVRVFVDDATDAVVDSALTPSITEGTRKVAIGLPYFNEPGWKVEIDNVTIATEN